MRINFPIRSSLLLLSLCCTASASALPFTYDFGFIGSESGFSGAGSFTISTSENLVADTAGLEAFEFSGQCAGYVCSFDLADVTTTGGANWSVNEATGEISLLAISAYGYLSDVNASTRLFLGQYSEIYLDCWDKNIPRGPGPCNGEYFDYRAEAYPGSETYVTLRPEPSPVPIPATVWLFGAALVGIGVVKRKNR